MDKWRHNAYEWLGLRGRDVDMAVLAELLLRGPQTEGDLRARANRMNPIPDLGQLQAILERLAAQELILYLTPPGQRRGAVVAHNLYPPGELERLRAEQAGAPAPVEEEAARPTRATASSATALADEVAVLRAEVETLRSTVQDLAGEVQALKAVLGA
ncbi:MAG: DUF480 domain-containing protein [Isosphaeraceae bacterium]|nr:DUF480 domain-containing protein [Isosphaeraceae bacterium]